jgi:two-component system chemotaxis response regulator CheY
MGDAPQQGVSGRRRIMLADDERHARTFLKALLKDAGYDIVAEATNGNEAVALFREHRPDLLLMDLNMPVKTGDDALREIIQEFPAAKVIVLSSLADRETVEMCIDLGAANYLRKDCSHAEIREAVRELLEATD